MRKRAWWLAALLGLSSAAAALSLPEDLSGPLLMRLWADAVQPHEALPAGVPAGFDWYRKPRRGAGNQPAGRHAATGWAQVFFAEAATAPPPATLQIRQFQTLLCRPGTGSMQWQRLQHGALQGRQFRADFADNANTRPRAWEPSAEYLSASFDYGFALHFWPQAGRFELPSQIHCGVLVLLQARQPPGQAGRLLLGLGADYWDSLSAPWDHYKTNQDIAIGRLRQLTPDWQWFGMTTATSEALRVLRRDGFTTATPPSPGVPAAAH